MEKKWRTGWGSQSATGIRFVEQVSSALFLCSSGLVGLVGSVSRVVSFGSRHPEFSSQPRKVTNCKNVREVVNLRFFRSTKPVILPGWWISTYKFWLGEVVLFYSCRWPGLLQPDAWDNNDAHDSPVCRLGLFASAVGASPLVKLAVARRSVFQVSFNCHSS
jgi:hypothetical protein